MKTISRRLTGTVYKVLSCIVVVALVSSCIRKSKIDVTLFNSKNFSPKDSLQITVSNIQVVNHQVVITGANLTSVSSFQIKEGSSSTNLQIESKTSTTIIANTMSDVTFAAGKIFDFIFSNAQAASTYTVNFSLCDSILGGKGFDCTTPTDKQVLAFDAVAQKWKPKNVNGLDYRGSWNANSGDPAATSAGEYWIVSVAGGAYQVGDWHVFNGVTFDRIDNSQSIVSVFGRTGVVTADLNDLSDVVISAPASGQVLKFNGTNWVNATNTYTESDPMVSAFAKTTLPTCGTGQVLKADGTSLSCVTDNMGSGAFSGTADRAVITNGSGVLATSSVSTTSLNYLSNVTSDIQAQLNAKQGALGAGSVTSTHVLDGTIADADLAGSISQSKITNLTTDLGNKQDTSTLAADVRSLLLSGLDLTSADIIDVNDSILSAFGKLQKQISNMDGTTLKTSGGTLIIGTIDGVPNPSSANQVANKAYVDASSFDSQRPSAYSPSCPTGYISVPAIPYYPGASFCVMKWEAKTGDAVTAATTAAAGIPKLANSRNAARASCRLIGAGYDLISNAQWQTIARNIADQASNWSSGTAYSGELNRGHSDGSPTAKLAAVADDNDPCNGTEQTCDSSTWNSQRRTHRLSNGDVIWDLGGNADEYVSDNSVTAALGSNQYISTQRAGGRTQIHFGNDQFCESPDASPYCGMGNGSFTGTAGAIRRGGDNYTGGIFDTNLGTNPTFGYASASFRCVFVP